MTEPNHMMNFDQKHHRVFYGWWIVGALFIISLYSYGTISYGFTAIFLPIADEFGWSYTQISIAASLRGVEAGLLAPVIGILVDRWGPRRMLFMGAIINGLGLMLLSRITSLGMFYTAFFLISLGMSTCTGTTTMTAVTHWFRRKVSTAMGIMVCGTGLGGILVPVVVLLVSTFGWRMTMFVLGLGHWAITLPLSLVVRHKPEQYGYLPDGEIVGAEVVAEELGPAQTAEVAIGAKQALTSRTFLHMALAFMCGGLLSVSAVTHVMPYLDSVGIAVSTSGLLASAIPLASIAGRLGFGWIGDRLNKKGTTALSFVIMCLGLLLFSSVSIGRMWFLVPSLIIFGIGYGGNVIMTPALISEYFGRIRFGTILGFIMGSIMVGAMIGPPLAGWVFDTWGSYQGAWLGYCALSLAAAVVIASTPPVVN
ncbi:MFS transporter [Chloroflexota bacterium]